MDVPGRGLEHSQLKMDLYVLALAQSGERVEFETLMCFALAFGQVTEGDETLKSKHA